MTFFGPGANGASQCFGLLVFLLCLVPPLWSGTLPSQLRLPGSILEWSHPLGLPPHLLAKARCFPNLYYLSVSEPGSQCLWSGKLARIIWKLLLFKLILLTLRVGLPNMWNVRDIQNKQATRRSGEDSVSWQHQSRLWRRRLPASYEVITEWKSVFHASVGYRNENRKTLRKWKDFPSSWIYFLRPPWTGEKRHSLCVALTPPLRQV